MHHLRAFGDKIATCAKDIHRELNTASKDYQAPGRQYRIGGKVVEEVRKLSEGGFAFVYIVKDIASGQDLALKKILCQVCASPFG